MAASPELPVSSESVTLRSIILAVRPLFFLSILSLLCVASALSQWTSTRGPEGGVVPCLAQSGGRMYAGTYSGVCMSTDDGATWTDISAGVAGRRVYTLNASESMILAGTDKGVYLKEPNTPRWRCIGLTGDSITSLAIVDTTIYATTFTGVWRTRNRGNFWQENTLGVDPFCLLFDHGILYVGGGRGLWVSPDSGAHWTHLYHYSTVTSVGVLGPWLFAGTLDGEILRRRSGDTSWQTVSPPVDPGCGGSGSFVIVGGRILSKMCTVLQSTDSGATWSHWAPGLDGKTVYDMICANQVIVAGTLEDGILRSTNSGIDWAASNRGLAASWPLGLAATGGKVFAATFGDGIHSTFESGGSWLPIGESRLRGYPATIAVAGTLMFVSCGSNTFRSTDGGTVWAEADSGLPPLITNAFARIGDTLFASNYNGLFRSTTGGEVWDSVGSFPVAHAWSMVVSGRTLYVSSGSIFRSTDGGAQWTNVGPQGGGVECMTATDAGIFAAIQGEGVVYSSDAGATWVPTATTLMDKDITDLVSVRDAVFASASADGVFLSTDQGGHWTSVSSGIENLYINCLAHSTSDLYAGVFWGGVWRRPLDEMIAPIPVTIPASFSLAQNYPNPFNPTTTIRYSLPEAAHVALTVYDVLGRAVMTLLDATQMAGEKFVELDASSLASGVYFYRMQAGGFVATRKLLVLR